jgi:hypothetical protein
LNEFAIQSGVSIADVVVVNGRLEAFEIKSDVDSVRRLHGQVDSYCHVFDRVTIVTTERHKCKIDAIIPKWWGILVAEHTAKALTEVRFGGPNPSIEPRLILDLLTRAELFSVSRGFLGKGGSRLTKAELITRALETLRPEGAAQTVRECLRARKSWSLKQRDCGGSEIRYGTS